MSLLAIVISTGMGPGFKVVLGINFPITKIEQSVEGSNATQSKLLRNIRLSGICDVMSTLSPLGSNISTGIDFTVGLLELK